MFDVAGEFSLIVLDHLFFQDWTSLDWLLQQITCQVIFPRMGHFGQILLLSSSFAYVVRQSCNACTTMRELRPAWGLTTNPVAPDVTFDSQVESSSFAIKASPDVSCDQVICDDRLLLNQSGSLFSCVRISNHKHIVKINSLCSDTAVAKRGFNPSVL